MLSALLYVNSVDIGRVGSGLKTPVALDRTKRFIIYQEEFTCLQQHRVMFHHQVADRGLAPAAVQGVPGTRTDGAALTLP